ncbi:hypothetical protein SAMN05216490_2103 [Mucilaginibacter mallensis]|uniref:Glycoside hydrolase 123-like N-terminal domain-containing protein n=1 Tax=Mucilaginibacter mallensis TaxID=652787 RepID=A0A1H1W5V0_MUCMA|nr:glycoside hydrolase domain-containing protein [Mucilaginibacter mallensis]SDS92435.1 hypothetical protein SAMN05216490_2103 [Mucilaginibacter mallensis]
MIFRRWFISFFTVMLVVKSCSLFAQEIPYGVPVQAWADSLGNHRAIIQVDKNTDAVEVKIEWRRRDNDADKKAIIITDENGKLVDNIFRIDINREQGDFVFQPNNGAGKYYVYYMPYKGKKNSGWWDGDYLKVENGPDNDWVKKHALSASAGVQHNLAKATVIKIESRTAFDSFYPMEVCATAAEIKELNIQTTENYLLFPEDRKYPIRMTTDLPYRWIENKHTKAFKGQAMRNEYYAFQVGVYAAKKDLEDVTVSYKGSNKITCFNTGGIDYEGKPFTKKVDVQKGKVQALWFGVDISKDQQPGPYSFTVTISPKNDLPQTVKVTLYIEDRISEDRGDSEPWRHSRLRWLNSTLGIDDKVVAPYTPLQVKDRSISCLMREVKLNEKGLPQAIEANKKSVLSAAIQFLVETDKGVEVFKPSSFRYTKQTGGKVSWVAEAANNSISLTSNGAMEFDGTMDYDIKVKAQTGVQIKDIRLEIPIAKQTAQYFMGMGLPGTYCPSLYNWKWKGPQDSYWIGSVEAGLHCELRGATYSGPMLNLYHPAPPPSWYNDNKGGFTIQSSTNEVLTTTYSGERKLNAGDEINFQFRLLITPVKKLNTEDQFTNRYYHNGNKPAPAPDDLSSGIKIINVHQGNPINPYINYPFVAVDSMKNFVDKWRKKGFKVKIYYTIRELTNQVPEIWALRSLGTEVLSPGSGGGYPWLREHYVDNYDVQWFNPINGYESCDAAVLMSGQSRWNNYYIEGLRWLVKNVDIDGLYLDDVSFDRDMLKRMRKVMDEVKPGCLIDLHSNTGFSKGPANQYTEYFPYINKLWFGESFQYDTMPPDNWMVETSGIPFGLMGDMLQGGGNPWRGMVYGMTARLPWSTEGVTCDPRDVWKIWDEFGISSAKMIGYWEKDCPVKTSNPKVLVTIYKKEGRSLISVASWADGPTNFLFQFDWKSLGVDPEKAILVAPEIKNFQHYATFNPGDPIPIEPKKGWLFYIQEKK